MVDQIHHCELVGASCWKCPVKADDQRLIAREARFGSCSHLFSTLLIEVLRTAAPAQRSDTMGTKSGRALQDDAI